MSLGVSRHGLHAAVEKLNNLALDVESDRLIQKTGEYGAYPFLILARSAGQFSTASHR
jgi:hypothetical protein